MRHAGDGRELHGPRPVVRPLSYPRDPLAEELRPFQVQPPGPRNAFGFLRPPAADGRFTRFSRRFMEQHRDEHITCAECGTTFVFSAAEAESFASKGLEPPKRCFECRKARRAQKGGARDDAPAAATSAATSTATDLPCPTLPGRVVGVTASTAPRASATAAAPRTRAAAVAVDRVAASTVPPPSATIVAPAGTSTAPPAFRDDPRPPRKRVSLPRLP